MEERRQIRAQRNRESAEKSRIRRKQQTAELEQSVGDLRGENKQLKMRLDGLEQLIKDAQNALGLKMSPSVDGHGMGNAGSMTEGGEGINGEAHKKLRALQESLRLIQICKRRCIRTFREGPQSQEIQLKLAK